MDLPFDGITFAVLLTAAGTAIAAAVVTALVELLKRTFGDLPGTGAAWAFGLSAVLYLLAGIATGVGTLDAALAVFLAWLACATAAVGIHSTTRTINAARGGDA